MKLLMTGFEPFCGERINPSEELLKLFSDDKFLSGDSRVETLLLPVSYQRSVDILEAAISRTAYDFILLCGQAGGRKQICLERVALNWIDADKADADGKLFLEKQISADGPPAYLSELPLRQWATDLRAKGFKVEVSNSAGAFVCNHIYYRLQHRLQGGVQQAEERLSPVLFVHIPYLTEQLMGKPVDTFGMSLEAMKQAMDELLTTIETYLQNHH